MQEISFDLKIQNQHEQKVNSRPKRWNMEEETKGSSILSHIKKGVVILVLFVIGGLALWAWVSLKFVYSSGERAGYIQKFSKKGWLFKTWEGELAMVNLPGALPEIFFFTVRDEAVAANLRNTMGNRVVLHYNEHRFIPTRIFGDTSYFVSEVRSSNQPDSGLEPRK